MDAVVKGRRGRKKSPDKIHIGRKEPLSYADAIRTSLSKERHRIYYTESTCADFGPFDREDGSFLIISGYFKEASECREYLNALPGDIDRKRVIYIPAKKLDDVKSFREAVEGLGVAFLYDDLMIFKDGSRYVYEAADIQKATSPEIREEMGGSEFSIMGTPAIDKGGMYDHLNKNVPAANLLVVTGMYNLKYCDYNINWTYLCDMISTFPDGMSVFNDIRSDVKYVDIPLKQTRSMSFPDGTMMMTAEEYRDFLKTLGMPSVYKTDKDVTVITRGG